MSSAHRRPAGGYRATELAAGAVGLLLPVLFVTSFKIVAWTPKYLALPLIAAAGACVVPAVLARAQRRAALLALAFGAWAGLATLTAPDHNVAFWGRYSIGTGLVFVLALIGAWMLGAAMRPGTAGLIEQVLLVACLANAGVALLQQLTDLSSYGLALYAGRSAGLYGNPVYLAELLAGGLWLAVCRLGRDRPATGALAVLVIAAGVAVSGSRFGLALAVVAAAAAWLHLTRKRAALSAVLIAVGLLLGTLLGAASVSGGGTTSVARVEAAPASGVRPRLETWRAGLTAFGARPFLGWGPSGWLAATSPHRTLTLARNEGPDRLFADAHDIVFEYAVTTGFPGLALLLAWIVLATRRRWREPLLGFAFFVLALNLLEPMHVGVTPVAFLALGAAGVSAGPARAARAARAAWRAAGAVVTLAALAVSGVVGAGFAELRRGELDNRVAEARHGVELLPGWSQPVEVVACLETFADISKGTRGPGPRALAAFTTAAERDKADPAPWNDLGDARRSSGDLAGATSAYAHALRRDPWSVRAAIGLAAVDERLGRLDQAAALRRHAALVSAKSASLLTGCQ
ncbi:MAG TPA: O-antigen ligase family protein [Acidimicrobiales bacterium]|nr:O-antigen ligase family protein [Acidimicrobiales bacterium]